MTQPTDPTDLARALPDQGEYLQLANNLLNGRGLVLYDERFGQNVYAYRTPGYPLFVALFGADVRLVRIAQAFIDTSTVLAVVLMARRWVSNGGSIMAGSLVALNPFLIYFSGLILSETLYTAMLTWGVFALLDARRRVWWLGLPLMLASVYVRPSAVLLTVFVGFLTAWTNALEWAAYHRMKQTFAARMVLANYVVLIFGLSTGLMLSPWVLRNYRAVHSMVWLTSNGGITAYDGFNELQLQKSWRERGGSDQSFIRSMPQLAGMNEIERDQYLKQRAREFVKTHPEALPGLTLAKILRTWSPVPLSADYGNRRTYVLAGLFYGVPFLILTVVGLARRTLSAGVKLVLIAPALYFTAVHAATVGSLRYRVPVEPLLAVVAGSALCKKYEEDKVALLS